MRESSQFCVGQIWIEWENDNKFIQNKMGRWRVVDANFSKSLTKSPCRGKPNEKQGPKTHQEDRKARKVQRKKCKGKQSAAKCRSGTEYKSAAKYKSATKYSSSTELLRQIKANWAEDPFDLVNIIWPTKAQTLLYKRIGVKNNMKKHDKKKQGAARSVNSRNCVKERKAKSKEMINTIGNAWRNKTETRSRMKQN